MRRCVDKICKGSERRGQAYHRPVETDDEDLGVGVERLGGVEVVGYEGAEPVLLDGGGV